MTSTTAPERRGLAVTVLVIVAILSTIPLLAMAVSQYADTRENVEYRCLIDDHGPDIKQSDSALKEARITALPAGRLCVWDAFGGGEVRHQTGWPLTIAALVASVAGLGASVGIVCLAARPRDRWLVAAPTIVTLGVWLIVVSASISSMPYIR